MRKKIKNFFKKTYSDSNGSQEQENQEIREDKKKGNKNDVVNLEEENEVIFKYKPTTLILIGIIIVLLVIIIELIWPIFVQNEVLHTISNFVKDFATAIAIAGGVGIIMELNEFKKYFNKRLINVLIHDDYIDKLGKKTKQQLFTKYEESIYFEEREKDDRSIFYSVKKDIEKYMKGCHIEKYHLLVECEISQDGKYITKTITKNIIYKNPQNNVICETKLPSTSLKKINDLVDDSIFKIGYLKIDGKPLNFKILAFEESSDDNTESSGNTIIFKNKNLDSEDEYDVRYYSDYKIYIENEKKLEIKFCTVVPNNDIQYCHRVNLPCRNYEAIFVMKHDSYKVNANGFAFQIKTAEDVESGSLFDGAWVRFSDWILPGDGSIFTITPKLSKV